MNKMDNYATKVVDENELQIKLLKIFEFKSYNIGYHVYKDRWKSVKGWYDESGCQVKK